MPTAEQERILKSRATGFALLAEASRAEADLIVSRKPAGNGTRPGSPEVLCAGEKARLLLSERRRRDRYLPAELFAEPSWDLLLALFIETSRGCALSTTDACNASRAPQATALRHLSSLKSHGLVETIDVANDNRRRDLRLTQKGLESMYDYIAALDPDFGSSPTVLEDEPAEAEGKKAWKAPTLESLVISARLAGPKRPDS